jgi:hypothetical protein
MTLALQQTDWYERLSHTDNQASTYLEDNRLKKDIWKIAKDLPALAEEAHITGRTTISFQEISLLWLKDLTKLAIMVKVSVRRWGLSRVKSLLTAVRNFNLWLLENGYVMPSSLTAQVVQQWGMGRPDTERKALQQLLKVLFWG